MAHGEFIAIIIQVAFACFGAASVRNDISNIGEQILYVGNYV